MLQKRKPGRLRRALSVEALEERVVMTGQVSVFAFPFPGLLGHLIVLNDNSPLTANAISINQVTLGGVPTIEVRGFNNTGVNGTTNGVVDFPINGGASGPINNIDINNPTFFGTPGSVTGNHQVLIGNTAAPTITGNLTIDYGPGKANVNAKITSNAVIFNGQAGAASGSDTVTVHDSQNGQISLTAGLPSSGGASSFTISNDTEGQVLTNQLGGGNNTLNITNNKNLPPPRTASLGIVNSLLGTGNNTVSMVNSIVGTASLRTGFNGAGLPAGTGKNNVTVTGDTIVGTQLVVDVENQSGEEGTFQAGGGPGRGKVAGSVNNTIISGITFTNNGNLFATQADGIPYSNPSSGVTAASTFNMTSVTGANLVNVLAGDYTRLWSVGNTDTPGTANVSAVTVNASFGLGSQTGKFDATTTGNQNMTVDSATTVGGLPASLTQTGSAGGNKVDFIGDNWPLTVGRHAVGSSSVGSEAVTGNLLINPPEFGTPVVPSEGVQSPLFPFQIGGPATLSSIPGNGDQITVTNAFVGGLLQIFEGHATGTFSDAITVGAAGSPVSANDVDLEVNTTSPTEVATINVTNSLVRDNTGLLVLTPPAPSFGPIVGSFNINDGTPGTNSGMGTDVINLGGAGGTAGDPAGLGGGPLIINSVGEVLAAAASGASANSVTAENVTAQALIVDGGGGFSSFLGVSPTFGNVNVFAQNFASEM